MNKMSASPPPNFSPSVSEYSGADSEISLRELVGVLIRGRWLLLSVLVLVIALGVGYNILAQPVYQADALVQVETDGKRSLNAAFGNVAELFGDTVAITSEIEILRSRMVVGRIVEDLGLEVSVSANYFPVFGRAYARLIELDHGDLAEPWGGMSQYAWGGEKLELGSLVVPPQLLGQPLDLVALEKGFGLTDKSGKFFLTGVLGELAVADTPSGRFEVFVRDLHARPGTIFQVVRQQRLTAIMNLQKQLKITERGKHSGILAITLDGPDPLRVSEIVNRLVAAYQRQNVERKSAEAAQTLQFLEGQLPKLKVEVEAAEEAVNQYRLKRGSADLPKETELILQQSVELEMSRFTLDQKREEALRRYTPDHPSLQVIDAQLKDLQREIDRVGKSVKDLPETQQELLRLARDIQVSTGLYTTLLNSAQQLQVVKAGTVGNVRIVDSAMPSIAPVKPKKSLVIALAAVLGVLLGIVAVFVRRALHAGVEDPAQVEKELGITAYASVPFVPEQRHLEKIMLRGKSSKGSKSGAKRILALTDPDNVAIEALRALRTSLHFGMLEAENNLIVLTSPEPQLGKSFLSINLGAVLALGGKRVLVVDMDLRRGYLHRYVGGERSPGLTEFIAQSDQDVVRGTGIEGLDLITTGTLPPNPAELLMHPRTVQLLQTLGQRYDYVLIDTPPILPVTDAALIARLAGTTLLVLKAGEHTMRVIEESVRRLQQNGVQVRGTIFNQVGIGGTVGYGYRYGYSPAYRQYKKRTD